MSAQQSPLVEVMTLLGQLGCAETALATLTEQELVALAAYPEAWFRANQWMLPPRVKLEPPWGRTDPDQPKLRIVAHVGGRGSGKTTPMVWTVHERMMSGAWRSCLCVAQSEIKAHEIFVHKESGLIRGAPPWERPRHQIQDKVSMVIWPNGGTATIAACGQVDPRGPEYDGAACEELNDWPRNRALRTWHNVCLAVRTGPAEILCSTTPRSGNPIIAEIKDRAERNPRVQWIRHLAEENAANVAEGYHDELREQLRGTARELEELDGIEADMRGLVDPAHIEGRRRHLPSRWKRRIVVLDPAITDPGDNPVIDNTGLLGMGLGIDDQIYPTADETAFMAPEEWAAKSVDRYVTDRCDCLVIETNRGGTMPRAMIRAEVAKRFGGSVEVVVVALEAETRWHPSVIYVKEVHAYSDRRTRAEHLQAAYAKGRISHPIEVDLDSRKDRTGRVRSGAGLETTLTTYEFTVRGQSPGDLDCMTWGVVELDGLHRELRPRKGQGAVNEAARQRAAKSQHRPRLGHPAPPTGRRQRDVSRL